MFPQLPSSPHSFIVCFGFKLLRKSNTWDSHQSNQNKPILEKYFQTFPLHGEFEWRREYRWAVRSAAPLTVLVSSLLGWSSPVTSKPGWSRRSSDPTTDCWGSTTTWRPRWREGQWGEECQSSTTLHPPLQAAANLHVRSDCRPAAPDVRRAAQHPHQGNDHLQHGSVFSVVTCYLISKSGRVSLDKSSGRKYSTSDFNM